MCQAGVILKNQFLGVSRKNKRISVILNKQSSEARLKKASASRGSIVVDNLRNPVGFSDELKRECKALKYAPLFHINFDLANDLKTTYFSCNGQGHFVEKHINDCGFYGHANSDMDKEWIKTEKGKRLFQKILFRIMRKSTGKTKPQIIREIEIQLIKFLQNTERYEDDTILEDCANIFKNVPFNDDLSFLSAICIKSKCPEMKFGTRTHSIIIVDKQNRVYFTQTDYLTGKQKSHYFCF